MSIKRWLVVGHGIASKFVTAAAAAAALLCAGAAWSAPPQISAGAAQQMAVLRSIKTAKTPDQKKIDSRLYLGLMHQRRAPQLAPLTDFRFVEPATDGRIAVDIALVKDASSVRDRLQTLGAVITSDNPRYRVISARVRLIDLEALAALTAVRALRSHVGGLNNAVNVSQGDATHGADEARAFFGISGAGAKICVLSDGVDSLTTAQASGDLPAAVDVLSGQAGSGDEGTAMLEIVHDLAPDAALGFATAATSEAQFAQNILDLGTASCDIIVDDFIYFDESPFQDGPVAQAVNTVTAGGALYFSSAGNEGNKDDGTSGTWEGDFHASTAADPAPLAGATLHDFGDGGNSILVTSGTGNPPVLIWAEQYDFSTGSASTDFDLYDMDGGLTTIFDASTNVQDGTGGDDFPVEIIGGGVFAGERLLIDKFAGGTTSSVPMFNLIVFRGEIDQTLATNGATRGHSAAAAAFSVAATPAAASFDGISPDGPYPGLFTGANASEDFSSDGPRRIILNLDGSEITPGNRTSSGGVVRQKPDITAADGVSTSAPGFDPFYGTSAAAPHAAAIAGLLVSGVPGLAPAQARTALLASAIDIEAPGTDRNTGAGIVMAHAALDAAGANPQAVLASNGSTPTEMIGDGDAAIEPNEVWSLALPLQNVGGVDATAISATLATTTPGVTISSASSAYPDIAVGASATNTTPFVFTVGAAADCGSSIEFTLTVAFSGGPSPQTLTYHHQLGAPGTPVSTSYTGAVVPIPDGVDLSGNQPGAPALAALPISGIGTRAYSVAMSIDGSSCDANVGSTTAGVDHSFINDLKITLIAPDATSDLVISNTDGGGNNLCQVALDDQSAGPSIQSVATAQAPFTGSYTPNSPLAVFAGTDPNGTWQLQAQDFFSQDTGNIRAFTVTVTPAVCDASPLGAAVTATKTVSGAFTEGGAVTYAVTLTNSGGGAQADNPGNEFIDVLPDGLTLVGATSTSGTAVADVGNHAVTWDGALAALGGSVTITITATIDAGTGGTSVSNQGNINYDSDGNGTNDASGVTDDPAIGGASDPTSFAVIGTSQLTITPTLLDFGDSIVGTTSAAQTAMFANTGSADLGVSTIDPPTAPFAVDTGTSTCPAPPFTLAPATSCVIGYTFAPGATGAASQALAIASDGGNATLMLQGNGIVGTPTAPIVLGGSPQQTAVETAFAIPLSVQVRDIANNPLGGVTVEFGAPASGASAVLSAPSATTDTNGVASVSTTANDQAGSYAVIAHVDGTSPDATFALTNTAAVVALAVSIDDGRDYAQYGHVLDYVVTLTNAGTSVARHVGVTSVLAPQLDAAFTTWICVDAGSGACTASGSGALTDSEVTIPPHGAVTYILSAPILLDAAEPTIDTAVTVTSPDQGTPAAASDTTVLVVYRNGFDHTYDDGADGLPPDPLTQTFGAGDTLRLTLPPSSASLIESVFEARSIDRRGFRIDRLTYTGASWLRLTAVDDNGREYATAWFASGAQVGLALTVSDGDVVLHVGDDAHTESLDLGRTRLPYAVRSSGDVSAE